MQFDNLILNSVDPLFVLEVSEKVVKAGEVLGTARLDPAHHHLRFLLVFYQVLYNVSFRFVVPQKQPLKLPPAELFQFTPGLAAQDVHSELLLSSLFGHDLDVYPLYQKDCSVGEVRVARLGGLRDISIGVKKNGSRQLINPWNAPDIILQRVNFLVIRELISMDLATVTSAPISALVITSVSVFVSIVLASPLVPLSVCPFVPEILLSFPLLQAAQLVQKRFPFHWPLALEVALNYISQRVLVLGLGWNEGSGSQGIVFSLIGFENGLDRWQFLFDFLAFFLLFRVLLAIVLDAFLVLLELGFGPVLGQKSQTAEFEVLFFHFGAEQGEVQELFEKQLEVQSLLYVQLTLLVELSENLILYDPSLLVQLHALELGNQFHLAQQFIPHLLSIELLHSLRVLLDLSGQRLISLIKLLALPAIGAVHLGLLQLELSGIIVRMQSLQVKLDALVLIIDRLGLVIQIACIHEPQHLQCS